MKSWIASDTVRAILLQGAGGRAFCSGGDVKGLNEKLKVDPTISVPKDLVFNEYNLIYELRQCCKPTISMLDGVTMGFGLGLGTSARYRVATEKTRFAMPENNIGIFPDVGFSFQAANILPPGVGRLMALTACHLLGSMDALDSKLASHRVNSSSLSDLLAALKEADLSAASDAAITACIERFAEGSAEGSGKMLNVGDAAEIKATGEKGKVTMTNGHAHKVTGKWYLMEELQKPGAGKLTGKIAANAALVNNVSAADTLAAARKVLEDAAAVDASSWASESLKAMASGAPLSQAVAWRLVTQAEAEARKDLPESERLAVALERDYATMSRIIYGPDFLEGTRAVLVDKDNSPAWKPATSSEVTDSQVAEITAVLPEGERHLGLTSLAWP